MRSPATTALILFCASPVLAQNFSLATPVDCAIGEDARCYIQNYVDSDPSPNHQDFTCNALSYNGHKGTDFALRSQRDLDNDISVLAAAPGTVKGTRDGMADQIYTKQNAAQIKGKECGNGLVIDHGNGWETQYCHLKRGSVQVQSGDKVATGDRLGSVGLSGKTQFPHLHISVRKDGRQIDPFNPSAAATCNPNPSSSLWADPLTYQPGGVIAAGFSNQIPEYSDVKIGTAGSSVLPSNSQALVLWGFAFGSRPGDQLHLRITDHTERTVYETQVDLTKTQAQFFRAGGRKTKNADWFDTGTYIGTVEFVRDGIVISDMETAVSIQ